MEQVISDMTACWAAGFVEQALGQLEALAPVQAAHVALQVYLRLPRADAEQWAYMLEARARPLF